MKSFKLTSRLRLLFLTAVVLPAGLLAFLAIRAINREEAYIEKQFERTLSAELFHAVSLINSELGRVRDELDRTAPSGTLTDPGAVFPEWKAASALVRTPFLLSSKFEILWPSPGPAAAADEVAFLKANREFVTDKSEIPVYQNIVEVFGTEIADLAGSDPSGQSQTGRKEKDLPLAGSGTAVPSQAPALAKDEEAAKEESRPVDSLSRKSASAAPPPAPSREKKAEPSPDYAQSQLALREFESNESIRQQVYQQARERGQQPLSRNVVPTAGEAAKNEPVARPESIFISEPMTFSRIIAGRDTGLIPRFLGEELFLYFWKRGQGGAILGCVIDPDRLRSRLTAPLPAAYSPSRVLTVLDQDGRPLFIPEEKVKRDWRRPFVSREVSELLPRWEAAAYLTDPGLIRSRADLTALVLWVLVLTFLVSILAGGMMVLKTLRREMELARNRTTFVTNVSHELKTPLTSIRMFAEMLREGRQSEPVKREQYLGLVVSETDRLTRLINNVLDFSRMEKGQKSYVPKLLEVGRLAGEMVEGQRPRLEHDGFRLALSAPAGSVFVRADAEAVKQALLNLLSNAEKYSGVAREIDVEVAADPHTAFIRVRDRGIGVPPQAARKIFQEFFRVDDSLTARTKGTGLGLSIARRLVRDQGGDVVYAPRPGGGSLFEIRLPRVEPS